MKAHSGPDFNLQPVPGFVNGIITLPWSHLPSHVIILQVILCCPLPSLNWNDLKDISIEAGFEFSVSNLKSTM